MEKKDGFIDLKNVFSTFLATPKGFFFENDKRYFYRVCLDDLAYREIIANEIANFLNIPAVQYELANIPLLNEKYIGVVSKDFKSNDYNYISGYQVLKDYKSVFDIWYDDDKLNQGYNNLLDLEQALNYRYNILSNGKEIVDSIMRKVIRHIFLFDLYVQNIDRHYYNYIFVENFEKHYFDLNKIYDNELTFIKNFSTPRLAFSDDTFGYDWYETLREFLKHQSKVYLDLVITIHNKLTPDALVKIINQTEQKRGIKITAFTKKDIITKYIKHHRELGLIIDEFKTKKSKKIILV